MAKKKRTTKKKIKEAQVNSPTTIYYKGSVNIALRRNGRTIKTYDTHNNGKPQLFNFILNCLAGNYYKHLRPYYVIPFYIVQVENEIQERYTTDVLSPIFNASLIDNETLSYKILLPNSLFTQQKQLGGLMFYASVNAPTSVQVDGIVTDEEKNNSSMIMYLFDSTAEEKNLTIENEDIIVTWQLQIVSAEQGE